VPATREVLGAHLQGLFSTGSRVVGGVHGRRVVARPTVAAMPNARGPFQLTLVGRLSDRPEGGCKLEYKVGRSPVLRLLLPAFAVMAFALVIGYAVTAMTFLLSMAFVFGLFAAGIVFLFLVTRGYDRREQELLDTWLAAVANEIRAPAR